MPLWLTVMAALELGGGLAGTAASIMSVYLGILGAVGTGSGEVALLSYVNGELSIPGHPLIIATIVAGLYLAAAAAGLLVLLRQRHGIVFSAWLQLLQIPRISIWYVTYIFMVGGALGGEVRWPRHESWIFESVGSAFTIGLRSAGDPTILGLNALSLVFLVLLFPYDERTFDLRGTTT
jgi:hypothetical protein